jgi:hypothetical protein
MIGQSIFLAEGFHFIRGWLVDSVEEFRKKDKNPVFQYITLFTNRVQSNKDLNGQMQIIYLIMTRFSQFECFLN